MIDFKSIQAADPELCAAMRDELKRQREHIELIASENFVSDAVLAAMGVAPLLPIIRALKAAGNRVISVLAGRTKELIILEKEVRESSDEVIIMTDDGSYGEKGLVTQGVEKVILREHVDRVETIGPAIMMKFVALLTKKYDIPTECSLNAVMVDGTGMCGACRVSVGGKTRFVCVEGPEFDAHQVDFDGLLSRLKS